MARPKRLSCFSLIVRDGRNSGAGVGVASHVFRKTQTHALFTGLSDQKPTANISRSGTETRSKCFDRLSGFAVTPAPKISRSTPEVLVQTGQDNTRNSEP